MKTHKIAVDDIYVPAPLRKTLKSEAAEAMAEEILENGMKMPIQVRHDGKRYIDRNCSIGHFGPQTHIRPVYSKTVSSSFADFAKYL